MPGLGLPGLWGQRTLRILAVVTALNIPDLHRYLRIELCVQWLKIFHQQAQRFLANPAPDSLRERPVEKADIKVNEAAGFAPSFR